MFNFDEHKKEIFLVSIYRERKNQLSWILQNRMYNIRLDGNLFVHRAGCVSKFEIPNFILIYSSISSRHPLLFECLGGSVKTESDMVKLNYPTPSGDYIVYNLGKEIESPSLDLKKIVTDKHTPVMLSGSEITSAVVKSRGKGHLNEENRPLHIATVFSGIGAPEQALLRLSKNFDIVFACDNGEREIEVDYEREQEYVRSLKSSEEKRLYVDQLYTKKSRQINFVRKSYLANYSHLLTDNNYFEDVKLLDGRDFDGKVDLFIGGSPCQSFSGIGARGGFEDTRGTLFYDYARLIKEIRPKVFIYENVYGLLTHDGGKTWETMQNVFSELGYAYTWKILDAKDYGIPQGRRRVFVVGFRDKYASARFEFPKPMPLEYTMQDFLEENCAEGSLMSINGKLTKINNKKGEPKEVFYLTPKLLKYCLSPGTKNFMHPNAKIDLPVARAILSTIANHHRSSVNNYVTTHGRIRGLSPREATRLMGFPDSYRMILSNAQSFKQAGNSIVVDVMMHIIEQIFIAQNWSYGKNKN